jgi:uncharacterized protein with HEPN domain
MPAERDERVYLGDILSAIERVIAYTKGGRQEFFADSKTQDAVIRNIEVMGEAVRGVSQPTRQAHPEIPWGKIAGTRDRVIHGYFQVDFDIVWDIVEKEIPGLRQQLAALLARP